VTVFALSAHFWTEALFELEGILTDLLLRPRGFVVFNVDRGDDPFAQMLVEGGVITAEASATVRSASNPDFREVVDRGTADSLTSLGWKPPEADPLSLAEPGDRPNFYVVVQGSLGRVAPLPAELCVRTLNEVWRVEPSRVRVRTAVLGPGKVVTRV
jgi:hypothetical protein